MGVLQLHIHRGTDAEVQYVGRQWLRLSKAMATLHYSTGNFLCIHRKIHARYGYTGLQTVIHLQYEWLRASSVYRPIMCPAVFGLWSFAIAID